MNRLLFRQKLNHLREDALRFQNTLCAYEQQMQSDTRENFKSLVWIWLGRRKVLRAVQEIS